MSLLNQHLKTIVDTGLRCSWELEVLLYPVVHWSEKKTSSSSTLYTVVVNKSKQWLS